MKIKTITCHDVYNSGASLQAYALQTYLISCGYEVQIINYKPDYLSNHFNFLAINNKKYNRNIFISALYLLAKLPSRLLSLKKKWSFDSFKKVYLNITEKKYSTYEELALNPPVADLFLAGSDQIWNFTFENGKDAAFYLSFAPKEAIKASYAASFAIEDIPDMYQSFLQKHLMQLDHISVREFDAVNILNKLGINGTCVCDPVFLISRQQWEILANKKIKYNYILIYDFDGSDNIKKIALELSNRYNLKIYCYGLKSNYAHKNFPYAGPVDFLSLIKGSQIVLSNSFHATAFSLIFEKEFYVIPREQNINNRMSSLLKYLNLNHRIIKGPKMTNHEPIDYDNSFYKESLAAYIERSKLFLSDVCSRK